MAGSPDCRRCPTQTYPACQRSKFFLWHWGFISFNSFPTGWHGRNKVSSSISRRKTLIEPGTYDWASS